MRVLLLICLPVVLLAQAQYQERFSFLDSENPDSPPGTFQQQVRLEPVVRPEKSESDLETEPTEPGPLDCREEQYPCTRLYSVHKPCKQCLNSLCFYSGPLSGSVLSLWRSGAERPVCINRRKLREELWWLLIENRVQGHYLPRHCRFLYHSSHPLHLSFFLHTLPY
ncbi:Microfibrillar-associated protein 2 [Liparis tanakae]|uniref:Microfibrillar-associated protein 2 n=1 Tax=Liparis tanakae TaxID=230148 RepID=A0A4Z2J5W4_9TELE|nr:Microfibrillar-associated protein 2 [Liparis tanakae]